MKTVSIICVYNKTFILKKQLLTSLKKQKKEYEVILVDNRNKKFNSAASALNYGASKASGDYLIFSHQDIIIDDEDWLEKTIEQLEKLDNPGIIGVAGKTTDRFIRTNILHGMPPKKVTPFPLKKVEKASTVDECLFIIPKNVFDKLKFDEKACPDWHLYATDYVLSVKKLGFNAYLLPTNLTHTSKGSSMSEGYYKTVRKLQQKHFNEHIIRNCMTDWYTYIPVSVQIKMKNYNKKHDNVKFNFYDNYRIHKKADEGYYIIDDDLRQVIEESELFDEEYYRKKYRINQKYDMMSHFCTVGYKKNYNPSENFDTEFYYNTYHDVKHADLNPLIHYIAYGRREGRIIRPVKSRERKIKDKLQTNISNSNAYLLFKAKMNLSLFKKYKKQYSMIKESGFFDYDFYKKRYPNVNNFNKDLILHYMFTGYKLNYEPNPYFDSQYYSDKYGKDKNPLIMYLEHDKSDLSFNNSDSDECKLIEKSNLFDENYYLTHYPETKQFKDNLTAHFYNIGWKNSFNPSDKFDTNWYLESYPDVKQANLNPLIHYLKYGQHQKRIPKPMTENEAKELMNEIDLNARNENLTKFDENSPLVSIIILTRNGIDYLKTLFKNFKQNICYPNYEIIVIDNDSSDESVEYLTELSNELPIKIIENKTNESFSQANNKGVEESNGEYVLLLNNDMEPIYGWLNHMMAAYLSSPEIGIVGAKLIFPYSENAHTSLRTQNEGIKYTELNGFLNENDGYIVPYNIKESEISDNDDDENQEMASVLGASLLIKKELYQEVSGLDDDYFYNYEDIDLCFRIIQKGYKVIYTPKAKLYHYYQATRIDGFDLSPNDMKNRIHLYQKWNQWLCEKLFIDRLENDLIFSEKPLKISYIYADCSELTKDPFIDDNTLKKYNHLKDYEKKYDPLLIKDLGWQLIPFKHENGDILIDNSDICICEVPINPSNIKNRNIHQIKIALIKDNIEEWENIELSDYDLIFTKKEYCKFFKHLKNLFNLNDQSLLLQIKNNLEEIYKKDKDSFNRLIKNYSFEKALPYGANYLAVKNSQYFDEKWYIEQYDISKDHLDPVAHYLKFGNLKGYNPGPNFRNEDYNFCNPDVKRAGINPLAHYERYGKYENRQITCSVSDRRSYMRYLSLTGRKYPLAKKSSVFLQSMG